MLFSSRAGRSTSSDQHPGQRDGDPPQVQRGQGEQARDGQGPLLKDLCLASQPYQQMHKSG